MKRPLILPNSEETTPYATVSGSFHPLKWHNIPIPLYDYGKDIDIQPTTLPKGSGAEDTGKSAIEPTYP